ncbi:hypothetical protein GGE65_007603 [Skermanella aerolata]
MAETINSLYKTEVIRRRGPWRSLEAVEFATLEWVDWFNHRRLLEPIGNIPPAEAEARSYAQTEDVARAASLNQIGLRDSRRGSHDEGGVQRLVQHVEQELADTCDELRLLIGCYGRAAWTAPPPRDLDGDDRHDDLPR